MDYNLKQILDKDKKILEKYYTIFLGLFVFFLITAIGSILSLQNISASKVNNSIIMSANTQKDLFHLIQKNVSIIYNNAQERQVINIPILQQTQQASQEFLSNIKSLTNGGTITYRGQLFLIQRPDDEFQTIIKATEQNFSELAVHINELYNKINKQPNPYGQQDLRLNTTDHNLIISLFNQNNKHAIKTITNLEQFFSKLIQNTEETRQNNYITQSIIILIGLIFLISISTIWLKKLILAEYKTRENEKEKSAVLSNVSDGLLLMNNKWLILKEGSEALTKIFGYKIKSGWSFHKILKSNVDETTLKLAEKYVNILFTTDVKDHMISELNPLKLISIKTKSLQGDEVIKYVSVKFIKINSENKDDLKVLVTIADSTDKKILQDKLSEEIQKNRDQFKLLTEVSSSYNQQDIIKLIKDIKEWLNEANEKMKIPTTKEHALLDIIQYLKNNAHGFKGEAGLLSLDALQRTLHEFETLLIGIEKTKTITPESLLSLPYEFKTIANTIEIIEQITGIAQAQNEVHVPMQSIVQPHMQKISIKYNKNVNICINDPTFENENIYKTHKDELKPLLLLMFINSIVHGIETPTEREKLEKPAFGTISLYGTYETIQNKSCFALNILDDGRGINLSKIKEKITTLKLNTRDINNYTEQELIKFIFHQDFSTQDEITMEAGRGIGLYSVKQAIDSMGGSILIETKENKYTLFKIIFEIK